MYTICYTHILTGQVDVFLEDGDADWLHIIEPGEETIFNMTINITSSLFTSTSSSDDGGDDDGGGDGDNDDDLYSESLWFNS